MAQTTGIRLRLRTNLDGSLSLGLYSGDLYDSDDTGFTSVAIDDELDDASKEFLDKWLISFLFIRISIRR